MATRSSLEQEVEGSNLGSSNRTHVAKVSPPLRPFFERTFVARVQWREDWFCKLVTRFGVLHRKYWKMKKRWEISSSRGLHVIAGAIGLWNEGCWVQFSVIYRTLLWKQYLHGTMSALCRQAQRLNQLKSSHFNLILQVWWQLNI